jgi:hypothetical protein
VLQYRTSLKQSIELDLHPVLDGGIDVSLLNSQLEFIPGDDFGREIQQSNPIEGGILVSPDGAGLEDRLAVSLYDTVTILYAERTYLHSVCC